MEAEVGRFEKCDCARMSVAHFHHLSRMTLPRRPPQKNQKEDGTAFLPSNPSCRAVRLNFLRLRPKRKKSREASPHFIQGKNHSGFSAKKVRTSTKNVSRIFSGIL